MRGICCWEVGDGKGCEVRVRKVGFWGDAGVGLEGNVGFVCGRLGMGRDASEGCGFGLRW